MLYNRQQFQDNFDFLDIIVLVSFIAQIKNMEDDVKETDYIHKVIKALANEVNKLHEENSIIIRRLNEIIEVLNNGINK